MKVIGVAGVVVQGGQVETNSPDLPSDVFGDGIASNRILCKSSDSLPEKEWKSQACSCGQVLEHRCCVSAVTTESTAPAVHRASKGKRQIGGYMASCVTQHAADNGASSEAPKCSLAFAVAIGIGNHLVSEAMVRQEGHVLPPVGLAKSHRGVGIHRLNIRKSFRTTVVRDHLVAHCFQVTTKLRTLCIFEPALHFCLPLGGGVIAHAELADLSNFGTQERDRLESAWQARKAED
ncbi:hypothetical protein C6380_17600 [Pseudomonas syringae pv. actinidiae]|nr:hypothetical protein BUE60_11385 [Pseudomonas syringae pv. actinidiae]PBK55529.1 hypothetical protein BUE61_07295 [Pseudomonas syringae pv. actinidiae]RJX53983.1 hypothetical protein C6380_17600 [Pseudomonas syringae pv. actinidiae]RJX63542.1 hypothetical protein C6379_00350 [Pseudomonas syringae pv. actinidiae]RJY23995.1 hypothetical protein C6381_01035 [Pseudomonas syringae pv. actinidiae]